MAYPKGKPRPPGSGRRKGTPNKVTKELREMITGALDDVGGQAYLKQQAAENPQAFLSLLGRCLPKDVKLSVATKLNVLLDGKGVTHQP